jgi:hypothetical protein
MHTEIELHTITQLLAYQPRRKSRLIRFHSFPESHLRLREVIGTLERLGQEDVGAIASPVLLQHLLTTLHDNSSAPKLAALRATPRPC